MKFKLSIIWLVLLTVLACIALFLDNKTTSDSENILAHPSTKYVFGTDELGRSLFARLAKSTSKTLFIGIVTAIANLGIGLFLGIFVIRMGRLFERFATVLIDLFWTIPYSIFAILALSILEINAFTVIAVLALTNWVGAARMFKEEAYRIRDSNWMLAAKSYGLSNSQIIFSFMLPFLRPHILSYGALISVEVFSLEAGLSFLGLSTPPPFPTWGGMIAQGLPYFESGAWIVLIPTTFLFLTVCSFYQIGKHFKKNLP